MDRIRIQFIKQWIHINRFLKIYKKEKININNFTSNHTKTSEDFQIRKILIKK